ncbi:hypothetical protein [Haloferax sp. DFSO60]|uniref:hypothetical protein n=1 Tax=Haloferax sp. DFSO60 TaxID=3388652 RepID=UPI00397AA052
MRRRALLGTLGIGLAAGCAGSSQPAPPVTSSATTATESTTEESTDATPATQTGDETPHLGVSLTPQSYDPDDFTDFFELVSESDLAVRWAGDWAELGDEAGTPAIVSQLVDSYDILPIFDTGVYSVNDRELFRPLDDDAIENYVADAQSFAEQFTPPYLGLGVEVNIHATEEPAQFERFVSLFDEAYDAIKAVSPETKVYTTFQQEWFLGLRGGLFGGENDPETAQWDLLSTFEKADLVGLTSYPSLAFRDPSEIPATYYTEFAERAGKPLALVETGWPAHLDIDGWESTETEQANFVTRLFDLLSDVEVALVLWAFVYQPASVNPAFDTMALRRDDGSARPAWDAWVQSTDN